MENINEQEKFLSVAEIFSVLRAGIAWIVSITFVCLIIGGVYAFAFKKTTYTAKIDAVIFTHTYETSTGEQQEISEMTAYQYSAMLVPQCQPVFKSNEVLSAVAAAGIDLKGSINFITEEESPYFSITYSYSQYGGNVNEIKKEVADTLNAYVNKCIEIVDNDAKTYRYLSDKITMYSAAYPEDVAASTGKALVLIIALLAGIVLSVIFLLIKNSFDDTVSKREQVEQITGNQIIAIIDISHNLTETYDKAKKVKEVQ